MIAAVFLAISIKAEDAGIPKVTAGDSTFNAIISLVYVLLAALAVLYIVRAGLLFITAQGDPGQITEARNTIVFAVVGLVASTVVFAAINWIAGRL